MAVSQSSAVLLPLALSLLAVLCEILAISWWQGQSLPAVPIQNAFYAVSLLLVVSSGILIWPCRPRKFNDHGKMVWMIAVAVWICALALLGRLIMILHAASRLGKV